MTNYPYTATSIDGDVSLAGQLCFPFLTNVVLQIVTRVLIYVYTCMGLRVMYSCPRQ